MRKLDMFTCENNMLSSHVTIFPFLWLHNKFLLSHQKTIKGRIIRKVKGGGGGEGEKPNKNSCKGKCQEKNSCKEEGKEKKFMQKEDPVVTFSESLSFRNQQYYQAQYE